jgi:hypothetical protein
MKNRMLPLLAALVLAVSAPLAAQTLDEPTDPEQWETQVPPESEVSMEQEIQYTEEEVTEQADQDEAGELPQTAGLTPLMALLGIASGAFALALRRRR